MDSILIRSKIQTPAINFRPILLLARIPSKEVEYLLLGNGYCQTKILIQRIHSVKIVVVRQLDLLRILSLEIPLVLLHFKTLPNLMMLLIHLEPCQSLQLVFFNCL